MLSRYQSKLHQKDALIKLQTWVLAGMVLINVITMYGWSMAPGKITLFYPPNLGRLARATMLELKEMPDGYVYAWAFYIFQQLNRWPNDGEKDYKDNLHKLQAFFTPAAREERLMDYETRLTNRELSARVRAVWEYRGHGFVPGRVTRISDNRWIVNLNLRVQETLRGETIKNRYISYQLFVVRYPVDPESNPWGLAFDGYAAPPVFDPQQNSLI